PMLRRMLTECALSRRAAELSESCVVEVERRQRIFGAACNENLRARCVELIETGPFIGEDRSAARRCLEQPAGGTPALACHRRARDVERQAAGGEERGVLLRRQVPHEVHVLAPGK